MRALDQRLRFLRLTPSDFMFVEIRSYLGSDADSKHLSIELVNEKNQRFYRALT